jgi:hypothetical protein
VRTERHADLSGWVVSLGVTMASWSVATVDSRVGLTCDGEAPIVGVMTRAAELQFTVVGLAEWPGAIRVSSWNPAPDGRHIQGLTLGFTPANSDRYVCSVHSGKHVPDDPWSDRHAHSSARFGLRLALAGTELEAEEHDEAIPDVSAIARDTRDLRPQRLDLDLDHHPIAFVSLHRADCFGAAAVWSERNTEIRIYGHLDPHHVRLQEMVNLELPAT